MNGAFGLKEAAEMLDITLSSLWKELEKAGCPYGFSAKVNGKRCYFVSREALEQWIKDNPKKYSNRPEYSNKPDYILGGWYSLKQIPTDELLEELKAGGVK